MLTSHDPRADGWESRTLGDCLSLLRNGLTKQQNKDGRGLPVTRIETITSGRIDRQRVGFAEGLSDSEVARYRLQCGDILFSHINSEPQIGRTAVYEGAPSLLLHGMNLLLLRAAQGVEPFFLHFLLSHLRDTGTMLALAGRAVGQSSINQGRLRSLQVRIPELEEQQRIAAVLSAVRRAVEQQERLIALVTELRMALMHKIFTEGTRGEPLKQTDKGMLPKNWRVCRFDDVFDCFDGNRVPVKQSDRISGPYPYYGASGIVDYVNDFRFDGEYLLIAEDGENLASRKLPIAFIASGKFWVNNHAHVVKNRVGNLHFFAYYISQMAIGDYLSGTTRPKLNKGQMTSILLPFPPEDEQVEIANLLTAADRKADLHARTHGALNSLFRTLLHQLMTTKVRVDDLDLSALEQVEQEPVGAV